MKGIVFNILAKLVEEKFGLAKWNSILEAANLPSKGAFTSAANYPDSEMFALVGTMSKELGIPPNTLIKVFGKYMLGELASKYGVFFKNQTTKTFLKSIDNVVHVEVRKLYPDAVLPKFDYEDLPDGSLKMIYRSQRKMCALAEGLIEGSADHFKENLVLSHPVCMHSGNDHCEIIIAFEGKRHG